MNIITSVESRRGCGYRKPGGLYLVSGLYGRYCGMLPIEMSVCPTCRHGIKPARGWTWINLTEFATGTCKKEDGCGDCPIADAKIQEVGLIWVGEKFYPSTQMFSREADAMGISRRISAIPRKFKLGETWVALGHRKAIAGEFKLEEEQTFKPGIFHLFQPARIEYVVKDSDSTEKLESLEKRGITLIKVVPKEEKEAA